MAAMYSWQHCRTGTLIYRQPRHLVIMDQWNGQQRAVAIKFCWISSIFVSSRFFCVTLYQNVKFVTCCCSKISILMEMIWLLLVASLDKIKVRGGNLSQNLQDVSILLQSYKWVSSKTHVEFLFHFRQRSNRSKL
jgi:hypothetical protein